MQFFVRVMETHKESPRTFYPEVACAGLSQAKDEAKRQVMESRPDRMLQADACMRNHGHVLTKYRCRRDERGDLHEYILA